MFQHQGIWLPDGERHFPEWMTKNGEVVEGKGTYQIKKLRAALEHVRVFRTAIDVGAHVGLWSMHLSQRFEVLHAFEPVPQFRACWERNVDLAGKNAHLWPIALGAKSGRVRMNIDPADTGGTHVGGEDPNGVEMRTLDECDFGHVDFIKLDCEGFEHNVIEGARETLLRWRPVVIVEQKTHKLQANYGRSDRPALPLLQSLGYRQVREMGGDFIMVPQ